MAQIHTFVVGGVALPEPIDVKENHGLLWSANAGRSSKDGDMIGDIKGKKLALSVKWGVLTETEFNTLKNALTPAASFFNLTYCGTTFKIYRSDIEAEVLGIVNGVKTYKSASADLIEK